MNQLCETFRPLGLLVARVLVAYMFLLHGTAKLFEFPFSMTGGNGSVELFSIFGLAAVLEVVGGLLVIVGLFTRFTSFILSGMMAVAYFMFHAKADNFLFPLLKDNGGEPAALFCAAFLLLVFTGAGKLSLDHKLFGNK